MPIVKRKKVKKKVRRVAEVAQAEHADNKYEGIAESSWEMDEGREMVTLHGPIGAGKTTTMASCSDYFPDELPTERWTGSKPKHVLEDLAVVVCDSGGLLGLKERGIEIPNAISLLRLMTHRPTWERARFRSPPTPFQAIEFTLNWLAQTGCTKVGFDTVSGFDSELEDYYDSNPILTSARKVDTRAKFGAMAKAHRKLHKAVRSLGLFSVYCCHTKALGEPDNSEQKNRTVTLTLPGMPELVLEITGKSAGVYKKDSSLQLAIVPTVHPRDGLVRHAYTITAEGKDGLSWESKNRRELSLDSVEKPHLRHIMNKWRGGTK